MDEQKRSEDREPEVQLPPESTQDLSPDEEESDKVKGGAVDMFKNKADSSFKGG